MFFVFFVNSDMSPHRIPSYRELKEKRVGSDFAVVSFVGQYVFSPMDLHLGFPNTFYFPFTRTLIYHLELSTGPYADRLSSLWTFQINGLEQSDKEVVQVFF